jgi:putative Holliday junction resolvase
MSRVLALDYGRARGGCAVSDPTGTLATPISAVDRPPTRRGLAAIRRLVAEHAVDRVVVGLPLTLRGEEGDQAKEARAFADRLAGSVRVPVELHDERLTTRQAARGGREGAGASEDSRAAAHLLEAYLATAAHSSAHPARTVRGAKPPAEGADPHAAGPARATRETPRR